MRNEQTLGDACSTYITCDLSGRPEQHLAPRTGEMPLPSSHRIFSSSPIPRNAPTGEFGGYTGQLSS